MQRPAPSVMLCPPATHSPLPRDASDATTFADVLCAHRRHFHGDCGGQAGAAGRGRGQVHGAEGVQRHAVRRRAGRRPADRLHLRRPRPDVGRRVPELPPVAGRRQGVRPRRHPRRHRRRRRPRQADRRPRQRLEPVRHRGRLRRRLALLDAELAVHPHQGRQAERPPANPARRLEPEGRQAQRLQRPRLGSGRLAVRLQRHPDAVERRCSGHPGGSAHLPRRRRLAIPPDAESFRRGGRRHDQPVGPRLGRPRRNVRHELRHRPPLAPRPRRPLPAHVRPGPEPLRLRPHGQRRRLQALGERGVDRVEVRQGDRGHQKGARHRRRRPRPQWCRNLPRRAVPGRVPQHPVHLQHPRQPAQQRRPGAHPRRHEGRPPARLRLRQRPVVPRHCRQARPRG